MMLSCVHSATPTEHENIKIQWNFIIALLPPTFVVISEMNRQQIKYKRKTLNDSMSQVCTSIPHRVANPDLWKLWDGNRFCKHNQRFTMRIISEVCYDHIFESFKTTFQQTAAMYIFISWQSRLCFSKFPRMKYRLSNILIETNSWFVFDYSFHN